VDSGVLATSKSVIE
jgi:uncharacterized membrane protein